MKALPKGAMDKVNKSVNASKSSGLVAKPAAGMPVKKIVTKTVHFGNDAPKPAKPASSTKKK
jgi:hypothetical protein